jgi:hypothetical protein
MQFRLPENLQVELLAYDPALKKLAQNNAPKSTKTKSKFPFGQPNHLIPNDVVRQSLLDDAIANINGNPAAHRYQTFSRFTTTVENGAKSEVYAIIYHYEQCWYAAWLPPKGKEDEYIYGYSFAFKDTVTANKMLAHRVKQLKEQCITIFQGRSAFLSYTKLITKEDLTSTSKDCNWNMPGVCSYTDKGSNIRAAIKTFEDQLKQTVPTWEDSRDIFERLICENNFLDMVFQYGDINREIVDKLPRNWTPSYETIQKLIVNHADTTDYCGSKLKMYNKILHILSTPFFRKWIQSKCDTLIATAKDPDNKLKRNIVSHWNVICELFGKIYMINAIWPECPVDYYQNHIDQLIGLSWNESRNPLTNEWLQTHMPVASFFGILSKFYAERKAEDERRGTNGSGWSHSLNTYHYRFHDWSDTINMISTLIEKKAVVPVPKRWRISEFHDTVQAEAWKLRNPNEKLPQDLFPNPIKITLDSINWTFIQPMDTHQLAQWGQAVRNCVGSANNYAEGVRKKKHFIVLCMVDGKPQFTVQLDVDMGMMNVKQIAGISNARLHDQDREQYTKAFSEALKQRSTELQSA